MLRTRTLSLLGGIGFVALAACSAGKDAPAEPSGSAGNSGNTDSTVELVKPVTVVEGPAADDVVVVDDTLTMPAATHAAVAAMKPGDVIVGDRGAPGSTNPTGFLRKVTSVDQQGAKLVVHTAPATLLEVVKSGALAVQADLANAVAAATNGAGGSGSGATGAGGSASGATGSGATGSGATSGASPTKLADFAGKTILDKADSATLPSGAKLGYHVWAKVKTGSVNFTPKVDVGATVKPDLSNLLGSLKEAHLIANGKLDADLQLDVGLKLDGNATGKDVAELLAQKITGKLSSTLVDKQFSLGSGKLGPIPVPINARLVAKLDCDLKWGKEVSVIAGAKATATISAGFRFEKDAGMSPVFEHSEKLDVLPPVWTINGDVMLECSVTPELSVSLFDMASGVITVDAYAGLRGQAICDGKNLTGEVKGEAFAGLSAAVHAKLDAFGFNWEKECSLFSLATPPLAVTGSFPLGADATCTSTSATAFKRTTHAAPPASCFDGGSGSNSTPITGGSSGTCASTAGMVVTGWTCGAEKWGDCKCDCACGYPDPDCKVGECGACDHDTCTVGKALASTCTQDGQGGACIKAICDNDPYCCENTWSLSCIAHIENGEFGCAKKACTP